MNPEKICIKCDKTKPIEDYSQDRAKADGRKNICKVCVKEKAVMPRKVKTLPKKLSATIAEDGYSYYKGYRIRRKNTPAGVRFIVTINGARKQCKTLVEAQNAATNASIQVSKVGREAEGISKENLIDALKALAVADKHGCSLMDMAEFYDKRKTAPDIQSNTSLLIDAYLEHQRAEVKRGNLREISLNSSKSFIENFRKEFGAFAIDAISHNDLNDWLDGIKTLRSRKNHRVYASALFNWIIRYREVLKVNPIKKTNAVTIMDADPEAYTVADARKLLEGAPDRVKTYVALGLFCGLRPSESLRVSWEDIEWKNSRIALRGSKTKKGRTRYIPLEANAIHILKEYRGEGLIVPTKCEKMDSGIKKVQRWMRVLAKKQGVRLIHSGMRHSAGTYHLALHGDIDATRRMLGHKDFSILEEHYVDYSKGFKVDAEEYFSIGLTQEKVIQLKQKTA